MKKNKGITLVALIITIIVLLILAGVSLSFVFNGGILDKSQQAVNEYENAANNESDILQYINSTLDQKINEINSGSGGGSGSTGIQVGDIVTAEDIVKVEDKSEIYGAEVKGYDCENNAGVESWKLFYADDENVYLIASNYIHKDYCPDGIGGTNIYDNGNGYELSMNNIIDDYNGASDITDESIKKLNEDYFNKFGSENSSDNMKAVVYMLDTSKEVWGKFAGNKAKYAIGGPTLELLFKSYNEKYNTNNKYQAQATSATGYKISSDGGESFGSVISDSVENLNAADDLYVIDETNNASAMWVASPSAHASALVYRVSCDGRVVGCTYYNDYVGFRPLVCLQSNVQLEKQQDGSFLLK